jgi:uncharacterized protein
MFIKCPRCGEAAESGGNPYRPFCSERCKVVDLGNWISGNYRIPTKTAHEDEDGESLSGEDTEKE